MQQIGLIFKPGHPIFQTKTRAARESIYLWTTPFS